MRACHDPAVTELPFHDTQDFEDARRGFVAGLEPGVVHNADGGVVWDNDVYAFLDEECPPTAHPSLWRQSRLNSIQGLFEVTPGIYQVRGLDLSNLTVVEGDTGIILIDPLISVETAAAALGLYRAHRGDRPVRAVIYTHSHVDHFGGVKGVTTQAEVDAGDVTVLAPDGFLAHAVAENVYAGTAMARRATYMYGSLLEKSPAGQIGVGLGQATSSGAVSLIAPTVDITRTGQVEILDGVTIEFQLTPGTEAPAEMNFFFPQFEALCVAENATHNLHNLVTLRGALVRDPHEWAAVPDRGHRPLQRPGQGHLRLPPLADLGRGPGPGVPRRPAGPLRLPARPDPATAEPGRDRRRRSPRTSCCPRRSSRPGTCGATTARSATT